MPPPPEAWERGTYTNTVTTALLVSTNDWYLNMDKGKYTGLIFADLKKAFDTVHHAILLKKN